MIVQTYVDYDVTFRKKGTRKVEDGRYCLPINVEIPDVSGDDHPVCVWTSEVAPNHRSFRNEETSRLKVGLRRMGDDFLRPVFKPLPSRSRTADVKPSAVAPEFARRWTGRRLAEYKGHRALVEASDFAEPTQGVSDRKWSGFQTLHRRSGNFGTNPVSLVPHTQDARIGDLRTSDLQERSADLVSSLRDGYVFVDGYLHERIAPIFGIEYRRSVHLTEVRDAVHDARTLDEVVRSRCIWFGDAQKALAKADVAPYERENYLLEVKCVVERDEALRVDESAEIASSLVASILSYPESNPDIFGYGSATFLRSFVAFRDRIAEGLDPGEALAHFLDENDPVSDDPSVIDDRTTYEQKASLTACRAFLDRFAGDVFLRSTTRELSR